MSKTSDFEEQSYTYYPLGLRIEENTSRTNWQLKHGYWTGPYGTVSWCTYIDTMADGKISELTHIDTTMEGRAYHRRWEHHFGDKTIARLCREFHEELRVKVILIPRLQLDQFEIDTLRQLYIPKGLEADAIWDRLIEAGLLKPEVLGVRYLRDISTAYTTDGKLVSKYA